MAPCYKRIRYVRNVRRSEVFALMKEAMAMRARRSRKRAGKEFVRNLIWVLVAYAPLAAILAFGANTPVRGVLIFGGIFVPVTAAFVTVVVLRADAGDGRTWGESGYHSGGTYYPGFLDDGAGDGSGGGDGGGGGEW
jgi:uncharacterized membrane protein YgcG